MSFSTVVVPPNISVIPVDTRVVRKVLYLPTVSTNSGRFLLFKDYYGTTSNSSFTISTTGTDLIDGINILYTLSNSWGSLSLVADGLRSWRMMNLYNGALTPSVVPPFVFNFTDFTGTSGNFTFVSAASLSNNRILVTTNGANLAGAVYYNQKVNIQSFTMVAGIRFELTNADGGTFVIQNALSNAIGASGGSLGYGGIGTSVAIRFDTWNGAAGQLSTDILTNGSIPSGQGASGVLNTALGITAGGTWNLSLNVTYNGTTLSYTITNTDNNSNFTSNAPLNIPSIVGANTAWIGFTGGTGGATEIQYVTSWNYLN